MIHHTSEYIEDKYFFYVIDLIINPLSLIKGRYIYWETFEVTSSNVKLLIETINNSLCNLGFTYESIDIFTIKRIDFSFNMPLDSAELAKDYISLLSKGDIYEYKNCDSIFKKMKKEHRDYPNEVKYDYSSFAVKCYNKIEQMKNINKDIPKEYKGYIRFEILAKKEKICYKNQKYKYKNIKEFLLNAARESEKQFNKYIPNHFKTGEYMYLNDALKYINACCTGKYITSKQAKRLCKFVRLTAEQKSIYKAKKKIGLNKNQIKKLMELFDEIDLNSVTIPKKWKTKGRNYKSLPSIARLMNLEQLP